MKSTIIKNFYLIALFLRDRIALTGRLLEQKKQIDSYKANEKVLLAANRRLAEAVVMLICQKEEIDQSLLNTVLKSEAMRLDKTALLKAIATLDPVRCGLHRPYLENMRWVLTGAFDLPDEILDEAKNLKLNILDIGSEALDSEDAIYHSLLANVPCAIFALDPFSESMVVEESIGLRSRKTTFAYFAGEGKERKFYRTAFGPASSNYEPDRNFLKKFHALPEMLTVEEVSDVQTHPLDAIEGIPKDIDFIKLDIQGSELDALVGAEDILQHAGIVQIEVEFAGLYDRQPLFGDVTQFMQRRDFELIDLRDLGYATYREGPLGYGGGHLGWADAIFINSDAKLLECGPGKLLACALILHFVYAKWDLAARMFSLYEEIVPESNMRELYNSEVNSNINRWQSFLNG